MSERGSIFRLVFTLVIAALLVAPMTTAAEEIEIQTVDIPDQNTGQVVLDDEGSGNEGEGVGDTGNAAIDSSSPEAGDAEAGDTGTGDGEAGDTGTGDAESGDPGTGDAEAGDTGAVDDGEAGDTGTGDAEAGDGFEGSSSTSNDDGFTIQQQVNHCDFTQKPSSTSWADWFEGTDPCLVVVNNQPEACGVVDFSLINNLVNFPAAVTHRIFWSEGPYAWNNRNDFPHQFAEDYNGGSVDIHVAYVTNERDYINGMGAAGHDIYNYYSVVNGGVVFTIDTDCEPNIPTPEENPNYFCETLPTSGSVDTWLANAPEGYNTDCLVVGTPVQACGDLSIPFTNHTAYPDASLRYVIGTDLTGTSYAMPATFEEDVNGGEVVITVYVSIPESDYFNYDGGDATPYKYQNDGQQFTIDTDCIPNIPDPGLPSPIAPEVCQVSYAGYTKMESGPGVTDRVKIPNQDSGEINGDGWVTTMRLYAATRDDLTNVSLTWTAVGGGDFGAAYNTLQSPAAGALVGNGYDQAASGYSVVVSGNTITATVASMPANSSISFNIPITFAEGQTAMYVHSWMVGDLVDCEPAVLDLPTITASVCDDNNMPTPVSVTAPESTESVTYSDVTATNTPNGMVFTFTATVNPGYTLDGATIPDGWTVQSDSVATYTSEPLTLADCEVPLEVVTPELPTLVAATCNDDNEPVLPTLTVPETDGITYSEVTSAPANSVVLSLTATANDGYTFAGATMPEGWTLVSSSEALYEIVADEAECPTEEPTVTPTEEPTGTPTAESTGTPTPEDPKEEEKKDDKAAEVKELPSTGAGSNPASMIGLAATAAAAIAGAGIFFTNRKR